MTPSDRDGEEAMDCSSSQGSPERGEEEDTTPSHALLEGDTFFCQMQAQTQAQAQLQNGQTLDNRKGGRPRDGGAVACEEMEAEDQEGDMVQEPPPSPPLSPPRPESLSPIVLTPYVAQQRLEPEPSSTCDV